MSDIFNQLQRVLDDGLILTPDVSEAIDAITAFDENDKTIIGVMNRMQSLIVRSDLFMLLVGAELMATEVEQSDLASTVSRSLCVGQVVGIMLGLLAAERIKTEVTK